jgi:hypothetical protein
MQQQKVLTGAQGPPSSLVTESAIPNLRVVWKVHTLGVVQYWLELTYLSCSKRKKYSGASEPFTYEDNTRVIRI